MITNKDSRSPATARRNKGIIKTSFQSSQMLTSDANELESRDLWSDSTISCETQPKHAFKNNDTKDAKNGGTKDIVKAKKDDGSKNEPCNSSITSEISVLQEEIQVKDDKQCKSKNTDNDRFNKTVKERIKHKGPVNESVRLGFSESSSLNVIQTCTDDPSIICHCKKTPTHSAPNLENNTSCYQLRGYETAPNLSNAHAQLQRPQIKYSYPTAVNNANTSFDSSFQAESDSELYYVKVKNECNCKHAAEKQVMPNQQPKHKITQCLRYDEERIPAELQSYVLNSYNLPSSLKVPSNTIPELYAAKVRIGSEDIPKQFVFSAINRNSNQLENHNEPSNGNYEQKKRLGYRFFQSKKFNKQPKYVKIDNNEFWEPNSINQIIREKGEDTDKPIKLKTNNAEDAYTYVRPHPPERIEIYYFDHGCSGYFRTTDHPPPLVTDIMVEKIDSSATRFWAEIFGIVHIFTTFIIAFILQLLRFIFYSIIRPLAVGIIQITSDYFFKPLLAIFFNAILQPIFIFLYNITSSIKDICELIAQTFGYFLQEIANVCRSIRFVEIRNNTRNGLPKLQDCKTEL